MYFYEKAFWSEFQSARIKLAEKEFLSKSSDAEMVEEYLISQENDINRFMWWYKQFASTTLAGVYPTQPIKYEFGERLKLEAKIDFSADLSATNVYVSRGLCFAIFDLMNRICCNKAILSHSIDLKTTVWPGTTCFWPESYTMPNIRFADYEPVEHPAFGQHTGTRIPSSLGLFHCGLPIEDEDRQYTAALMEFLSLTWILYHEEAHYWQGHIHYLDAHETTELSETDSFTEDAFLLKTFEWQADRKATLDLMNMFFVDIEHPPFELPAYFKTDHPLSWYIRIIICALGANVLVFQKVKIINNKTDYYPSPECRMSTILGIIYATLMHVVEQRGNLLGISDPREARNTITDALITGLYDLFGIEEVIQNDVDYENDVQRVVYEKNNPQSLLFIGDMGNISKIIVGLIKGLQSEDQQINQQWFDEHRILLKSHEHIFNNVLPLYRQAAAGGKDPLNTHNIGSPAAPVTQAGDKKVVILLVQGENAGGFPIFAYVAVPMANVAAFKAAQASDNFYPEDFGAIIESGEGEPSGELRDRMEVEYGFSHQSMTDV